ncbi:cupin domain-containing protein, partial [Nostocoides jenkinsii]|uniref:cupin domain-containing protein n=1 Tax=Nostocoides jenkinsii TaxID=330834 RepID=UPI002AA2A65B
MFSNAAADELLSTRGLRTPFLRVAKDGRTYAAGDYTAPGGVGAEIGDQLSDSKLLALFADGATLVLQGLHRTWAPISRFAGDLAAELGHPVQVNAYVTPAQNTGFSDHYDVHDVFVVQIAGTKTWRIRPPVLAHPLRTQPWENRKAAVQQAATRPPLIETTLQPGDTLYLPRGFIHAASARGEVSTHLTIGIHTWTGHHLGRQLQSYAATRLAADPRVRA